MTAKGISTGIEHLRAQNQGKAKATEQQSKQLSKQWKDLRNRLDMVLMPSNVLKGSELRQQCLALDGMTLTQRVEHIKTHWGPLFLEKSMPLLQQIDALEQVINKLT